ncbi:uncharacterized protein B0P05DRAFT_558265 [Gilbertella persicaria]|uniref:uncharacterized protein n=1 Tax=Gilbertella persicaria TaxID=101096 RepID=UPI00221EBAE0|nr:uncharacterized protein B0P05DRAFT_558265 [Gilbertella persicaria]KAI8059978.1 hypothetical protein B0P05DRAFT_558265 [Gilbertella persicaria]
MAESAFAQHIIQSIRNELSLLKTHNYIQPQAYNDILRLLPTDANRNTSYPPFENSMPTPGSKVATPLPPPSYNESKLGTVEALYDYHGQDPVTDLSFRSGDMIALTELVNNDWWKGTLNGKTGIFPSNYVKRLEPSREKVNTPPPPPARQPQRDSYGYSPLPPKQDSYSYPPPPPTQQNSYGAPPPQQNSYGAPPPQNNYPAPPPPQANSYAPPAQNYQSPPPQQVSYAPPPVQQVTSTSSAPAAVEQHESKMSSMGKQLAGNVVNAATWGFGGTLGSDLAHSIF